MPPERIEELQILARRFHLLPTRMDYAKALWLNGRQADAENELRIEREWQAWKEEHCGDVAAARAAATPASEPKPRPRAN